VGLGGFLVGGLALEQIQAILVCLQLGDGNLARVDADRDGLAYKLRSGEFKIQSRIDVSTVNLLALDALNVDDPLAAVDLDDTALTALEGATGDDDLVVLAHGHALDLKKNRV